MNHSQILAAAYEICREYGLEGTLEVFIQSSFSEPEPGCTDMKLLLYPKTSTPISEIFEKFKRELQAFNHAINEIKRSTNNMIIVKAKDHKYLLHLFNVECAMKKSVPVRPLPEFYS